MFSRINIPQRIILVLGAALIIYILSPYLLLWASIRSEVYVIERTAKNFVDILGVIAASGFLFIAASPKRKKDEVER